MLKTNLEQTRKTFSNIFAKTASDSGNFVRTQELKLEKDIIIHHCCYQVAFINLMEKNNALNVIKKLNALVILVKFECIANDG